MAFLSRTPSHDDNSTFDLLSLPGEILNRIYRLAVVSPLPIYLTAGEFYYQTPLSPGLLRTCRRIHAEASELFYAENTFICNVGSMGWRPFLAHPHMHRMRALEMHSTQPTEVGVVRDVMILVAALAAARPEAGEPRLESLVVEARWLSRSFEGSLLHLLKLSELFHGNTILLSPQGKSFLQFFLQRPCPVKPTSGNPTDPHCVKWLRKIHLELERRESNLHPRFWAGIEALRVDRRELGSSTYCGYLRVQIAGALRADIEEERLKLGLNFDTPARWLGEQVKRLADYRVAAEDLTELMKLRWFSCHEVEIIGEERELDSDDYTDGHSEESEDESEEELAAKSEESETPIETEKVKRHWPAEGPYQEFLKGIRTMPMCMDRVHECILLEDDDYDDYANYGDYTDSDEDGEGEPEGVYAGREDTEDTEDTWEAEPPGDLEKFCKGVNGLEIERAEAGMPELNEAKHQDWLISYEVAKEKADLEYVGKEKKEYLQAQRSLAD
ncbi:MAG: hypothetical protein M1829_004003 [Trizodia sp. TS-e1964]|nr:MAG: hypothetical protein M1829_004003 [Trizodia sp. TS-e1964]